ncbi:MAG: hypothetical protein M3033_08755 [Acidobacteriota bacterium]|nr:hypothetical protein [Acidobacteriota bacterium]
MIDYIKILIVILLAVLSFEISAFGQMGKRKTDVEERELSGPVHEVRFSRKLIMNLDGEKEFGGGWMPGLMVFNRDGFLEKSEVYDDEGKFQYKIICRFDSSGQKIEEIETKANGELSRRRTFSYDENGNQKEMNDYYGEEDKFDHSFQWTYDDKGLETGDIELDNKGSIVRIAHKSRIGNDETTDFYNSKGEFVGRNSQSLSKSENQQKEEIIDLDKNSKISSRFVTTTNGKGNVTEIEYNSEEKILEKQVYVYERDTHGNWTKETVSEWTNKNGQLLLSKRKETNREITYF